MTKAQRTVLTDYVRTIADLIGLRDWTFELQPEFPADDARAAWCRPIYGRRLAHIAFRANTPEDTAAEVRNTVVHELLHCHLAPVQCQIERDLEPWLGKGTDQIFFDSFKRNLEYAVDALSTAVGKHYPLIAWQ